jgi:hypothetical protein
MARVGSKILVCGRDGFVEGSRIRQGGCFNVGVLLLGDYTKTFGLYILD